MVFSSIPAYLDPSNWQQQSQQQINVNPSFPPPPPQVQASPLLQPHGGGSIRPGSMSERARLANVPMPEMALRCPRCDSTNTKFCYFNNYSLSQPRHFCKTCRRYWTRGGALRSVPVGGGCRKNKRSTNKSSTSKSPVGSNGDRQAASTNNISGQTNLLDAVTPQIFPPLRFTSPLRSQFSTDHHNFSNEMGLNYSGNISAPLVSSISDDQMNNFNQGATNFLAGGMSSLFASGGEPWRVPQFPFLGGNLDPSPPGMFRFQSGSESGFVGGENMSSHGELRPKLISTSLMQHLNQVETSVKMEENSQMNLSKRGMQGNIENWTEIPSFISSSTSNNNPL